MPIFVVCETDAPEKIEAAIKREFPHDHYKLSGNVWLISASETTQQVAQRVGAVDPDSGAVVFRTSTYFGLADPAIWEWVALKLGK